MLRALVWKEWREQRTLLLTGLAVGLGMPVLLVARLLAGGPDTLEPGAVEALAMALVLALWPLLAGAAAASALAGETAHGTWRYLLTRPVSRVRVWTVKVAVAGTGVSGVALVSWMAARGARSLVPGPDGLDTRLWVYTPWLDAPSGASPSALLFATTLLFAALLDRALNAAAAALAASLAILAGLLLAWSRLGLVPTLEPQWLAAEVVLVAALVALASLLLFARPELLRGAPTGRRAGIGLAVVALAAGAVALPGVWKGRQLGPGTAVLRAEGLASQGEIIVGTAVGDGGVTQAWRIFADGRGLVRLAGRHTFGPVPAGRRASSRIAYFSRRGLLGRPRPDRVDLRISGGSNADGQLLVADLPAAGDLAFAGSHLVLRRADTLWIIERYGGLRATLDLAERDLAGADVVGHRVSDPGPSELMLVEDRRVRETDSGMLRVVGVALSSPDSTEHVLRPVSGAAADAREQEAGIRVIYEGPARWQGGWTGIPRLYDHAPLAIGGEEPGPGRPRLAMLDLEDGTVEPLAGEVCRVLFWGDRDDPIIVRRCRLGDPPGRVRVQELHPVRGWGPVRLSADAGGEPLEESLQFALGGTRAAVRLQGDAKGEAPGPVVLLGATASPLETPAGWDPVGWIDEQRFLLRRTADLSVNGRLVDAVTDLAVANARTGALQSIYPRVEMLVEPRAVGVAVSGTAAERSR